MGEESRDAGGEVTHDEARRRFELEEDGETGFLTYSLQDRIIVFTHTIVPPELEGRGIGGRIVEAGLGFARECGLKVVPQCSFVRGYIERHKEHEDLLAS
ncbi:MAG TPA: GNAT family N-acetyltransferase [Allosphingosinicella sp.]